MRAFIEETIEMKILSHCGIIKKTLFFGCLQEKSKKKINIMLKFHNPINVLILLQYSLEIYHLIFQAVFNIRAFTIECGEIDRH